MSKASRSWIPAQSIFLVLGFATLTVISAASIALVRLSQSAAEMAAHSFAVKNRISDLQNVLLSAETAQRGYLLGNEAEYLETYRKSVDAIEPALNALRLATIDNDVHQQSLRLIEPVIVRRLEEFREVDRLLEAGDAKAALARLQRGPRPTLVANTRMLTAQMSAEEERQLAERGTKTNRTELALLCVDLIAAALMLVLSTVAILLMRRSHHERQAALAALEDSNARLEATVQERTLHLQLANEEMHRSAAILKNTITSMADAVLVVDETGTVVISNPASHRLFGARADVGSQDWQKIYLCFLPDEATPFPPAETPIARAVRGENVDDLELVLRRKGDTKNTHLVANGRPMVDAAGRSKGAVLVYHDVTALQETERQLRQSQKMEAVGQLTGGIAHDFNNILTVIMGTIGLLSEAVAGRPQFAAIARMIDEAAERGAELTRHLLAFARKQPLRPQPTDINQLVTEIDRLLRPTLGEQVQIATILEPDTWAALVDQSQLTTALLNLALNARDAMPDGGKLTLEAGNIVLDEAYAQSHGGIRPGFYVVISVSDTGTGIPAGIRDKVFEPFFTTKGTGKGTGLGLSMVYGFVKQSNGHVKIYSEEGYGTTVRIYLPRSGEQVIDNPTDLIDAQRTGGSETILVVEDDPLVRSYVTTQLGKLGYSVESAPDADEALEILNGLGAVDLLLTDVILPGAVNGPQLAEIATRRQPSIKVLFTSGYTENAVIDHGHLDPGVLLLAKPYRVVELARMVRLALDEATVAPLQPTAAATASRVDAS
ncbi:MAG: CHASE3 domain-containing protein [Xanthobacteraceae bacterium]